MDTFLERLGRALWGAKQASCDPSAPALRLVVRCAKCGEIIRCRVEKAYELEAEYSDNGNGQLPAENEEPKPAGFTLHKELVGAQCQNLIHVAMRLDAHRCIVSRHIEGGEFVDVADCE